MTKIVTDQIQRRNGSEFTLPLKDGSAGASLTTDGKGNLYFPGTTSGTTSGTTTSTIAPGQAFYGFGDGTYTWTCPAGVTSVSVVAIGGGACNTGSNWASGGGGGGGLGWKNDIPVIPGNNYTVVVGKGGDGGNGTTVGGDSYFINTTTVCGFGGNGKTGGSYTGTGGGTGGAGGPNYSGGGAGGYTGAGGTQDQAGAGGGGAGGTSYSSTYGATGGGGVGPFGQGASGVVNYGAGGGSGGESASSGENPSYSYGHVHRPGGLYGGGGGGAGSTAPAIGLQRGGRGCVRIIWGTGRSFPSTGTGDM